ncbi:MAG: phage tail tape measure protein [Sulfuricurvum sp.]|nr:phage tail tape measure protein [Sulfuricurvum sp.]
MVSKITDTYRAYSDLTQAQGEIASLGIGDNGIAAITAEAKAFSNQWAGTTAPDFIRASYDIKSGISSLSDTAVGKFTSMSALTASATKSTTAEMTKLFALGHGIYRQQFGSDIEFGEQFSAAISQAVKAFRTDGSDLSGGLSALGAVATSFGIGLSEQLAILGTAKGAFNSASEAATSYRAFLNGAGKAQKELGLTFIDSQGKMLPMSRILQKIKDKYGDISKVSTMDKIKKAFGSDEAVKMLTAMIDKTGDLEQSISDLDGAMKNGTKTTEEMAKAMQRGKGMELLDQQIGNLSATIGEAFAPAVESVSGAIGKLVGWIGGLSEENKTLFGYVAIGIGVVGGLATALGAVGIVVMGVSTALPTLGAAMTLALGPIGLIAAGVAAVAYAVYSNWTPLKTWSTNLWKSFSSKASAAWAVIKNLFSWTPLGMIIYNWGAIKPYFSELFDGVKAVAGFAWGGLKTLFAWTPIGMIVNNWGAISSVFSNIVEKIKKPFVEFFGWIGDKFTWMSSKLGSVAGFFANNDSSMLTQPKQTENIGKQIPWKPTPAPVAATPKPANASVPVPKPVTVPARQTTAATPKPVNAPVPVPKPVTVPARQTPAAMPKPIIDAQKPITVPAVQPIVNQAKASSITVPDRTTGKPQIAMAPSCKSSMTNNHVTINITNPKFDSKEQEASTRKQIVKEVEAAMKKINNDKKDRAYA